MTSPVGTPVFSDDSGVRRVTLQVAARALVGLFVLVTVALAVSLVLGVPLPGLDRLVPGKGPEQQHQATRDAPLAHNRSGNGAWSGAVGADGLDGRREAEGAVAVSTKRPSPQQAAATRRQQNGAASSGAGVSQPVAEPVSQQSAPAAAAGSPSATPSSSHPGNARPSAKPRNPKAATPTRGSSAFSSSRAHRATSSADPTQSTPGRSGASHGKSGTAGSG